MKKSMAIVLYLAALVFGVGKIRPQVNTLGQVLHYKLWAGLTTTATVFDYSLNGNDGTVSSVPTPVFPGFDFDGSDDYIDTNATFQSTLRGSFTISLWIKPDDGIPGTTEALIGVFDTAGANSLMVVEILDTTGKVRFQYISEGNAGTAARENTGFSNGQETWHHVAVTIDSTIEGEGAKLIYIDGDLSTLDFDGDTTGVTSSEFTTADNIFTGALNTDGTDGSNFEGLMDDVRIFDVVKSAAEIKSIYEQARWRYGI